MNSLTVPGACPAPGIVHGAHGASDNARAGSYNQEDSPRGLKNFYIFHDKQEEP